MEDKFITSIWLVSVSGYGEHVSCMLTLVDILSVFASIDSWWFSSLGDGDTLQMHGQC